MKTALKAFYVLLALQLCNPAATVVASEEESPPLAFTRPPDLLATLAGVAAKIGEAAARAGRAVSLRLGTSAIVPEVVKRAQEVMKHYNNMQDIIDRANNPNGF